LSARFHPEPPWELTELSTLPSLMWGGDPQDRDNTQNKRREMEGE